MIRGKFSKEKTKSEFDSKLLDLARVIRVSAGGRRFRFRATVVVGNKAGKVGVGVAKGVDVAQAIEKASRFAKKDLIIIPITNESIAYDVSAKAGAAKILLRPQNKGRGLVAGGAPRVVCELGGIKNISAKILTRTSNKLSNARATIEALKKLKAKQE